MTIYDRLKADHDRLRDLFARLTEAEGDDRRPLFMELQRALWAHHKIEEVVFYEPLRHAAETRGEVLEGLNEHHMLNGLTEELNAMPSGNEAWTAKLQVLDELVRHHLDEEEEEIFEEAKSVLDDAQARLMAGEWDARRAKLLDALAPLDLPAAPRP